MNHWVTDGSGSNHYRRYVALPRHSSENGGVALNRHFQKYINFIDNDKQGLK
jgi:hypothetical protein